MANKAKKRANKAKKKANKAKKRANKAKKRLPIRRRRGQQGGRVRSTGRRASWGVVVA